MIVKSCSLKFRLTISLLGWLIISFICCKPPHATQRAKVAHTFSNSPLEPVNADVAVAQARWPRTTLSTLKDGYNIFNTKCQKCHDDKIPQDYSMTEWKVIMRQMGRKAKLDSIEYNLVLHYVLTQREAILIHENE